MKKETKLLLGIATFAAISGSFLSGGRSRTEVGLTNCFQLTPSLAH